MENEQLLIDKTSLIVIADAVRAKGGTTELLVVPQGVVNAINNLSEKLPSAIGKGF